MNNICLFELCDRVPVARNLCNTHYSWVNYNGLLENYPLIDRRKPFKYDSSDETILRRLWERTQLPDGVMGCWVIPCDDLYPCLRVEGKTRRVHKLIHNMINTGDPVTTEKPLVRHLCGNNKCWNPKHLKAGTYTENVEDAQRHGTRNIRPPAPGIGRGEKVASSKLTEDQVRKIWKMHNLGQKQKDIGMMFNVTHSTISDILRGKTWRHVKVNG